MVWDDSRIDDILEEMRLKLKDCHYFLDRKRRAYEKFDRFETPSADPYSAHQRTMDSRSDDSIVQFLRQCERSMPRFARHVHSIDELNFKWRELHNFWTDLWEAVNRAEVRASVAESMHFVEQARRERRRALVQRDLTAVAAAREESSQDAGSYRHQTRAHGSHRGSPRDGDSRSYSTSQSGRGVSVANGAIASLSEKGRFGESHTDDTHFEPTCGDTTCD